MKLGMQLGRPIIFLNIIALKEMLYEIIRYTKLLKLFINNYIVVSPPPQQHMLPYPPLTTIIPPISIKT